MIRVKVQLREILKDKVKAKNVSAGGLTNVELAANSVVDDLLAELGLPEDLVGLVVVNGRQASYTHDLEDGDRVDIFSPIYGG